MVFKFSIQIICISGSGRIIGLCCVKEGSKATCGTNTICNVLHERLELLLNMITGKLKLNSIDSLSVWERH